MIAMATKMLKRKEVDLGFINIPAKNRAELIGNTPIPFSTKVNEEPAKIDKYGGLWSDYLKDRFPLNTEVTVAKNGDGFLVTANEQKQEPSALQGVRITEEASPSPSIPNTNGTWFEVMEGDCVKHLIE